MNPPHNISFNIIENLMINLWLNHNSKIFQNKEIEQGLSIIHMGALAALESEKIFIKKFVRKEIPDNIPEFILSEPINLIDLLLEINFVTSKNEAKRLISFGAIRINNGKIFNEDFVVSEEGILKVGKRKFLKIRSQV